MTPLVFNRFDGINVDFLIRKFLGLIHTGQDERFLCDSIGKGDRGIKEHREEKKTMIK